MAKEKKKWWNFLEHKGPVFSPNYKPLPSTVKFKYDGNELTLSENAEEVAGFYAKLLNTKETTDHVFNSNFFKDWREKMTPEEKEIITDLSKCDFIAMADYLNKKSDKVDIPKDYQFCNLDYERQKIENWKVESPGLLKSQGKNRGKVKKRIKPEDVTINCSEDSQEPQPYCTEGVMDGHKWQLKIHDNTKEWLARYKILHKYKYMELHPSTVLKSNIELNKYETARKLHLYIDKIRESYRKDWENTDMAICQRSVALYFIDFLGFRAGDENDDTENVGCCLLRVKHVEPEDEEKCTLKFNFLGKSSVKYDKVVKVEKKVVDNIRLFRNDKSLDDELFDKLTARNLNNYLRKEFGMPELTAKVFRTYNASIKMKKELDKLDNPEAEEAFKKAHSIVVSYCHHKDPLTSKLSYIDPRIIVAWCKKHGVQINKVYTTQRLLDKHSWAIENPDYFNFKYDDVDDEITKKMMSVQINDDYGGNRNKTDESGNLDFDSDSD
ncbi:hypothetical protein O0L34_g14776 [Tuta absoluta]|nr:hypothetical protein O0L34_g14776 [Tuta absoluta]